MLVDYQTSGVGPYQELLFIPGLFKLGGTTCFSISKIYVSTYDSVWNGRRNWGIPKELASFTFINHPSGLRAITVRSNDQPFFSIKVKSWGPKLPVTTKLLPSVNVVQKLVDLDLPSSSDFLLTRPSASGTASLASISYLSVGPLFFPDISEIKLLLGIYIDSFQMTFPLPKTLQ